MAKGLLNASGQQGIFLAGCATLVAGDYVEVMANQQTAGSVNFGGTGLGSNGSNQAQFYKLF